MAADRAETAAPLLIFIADELIVLPSYLNLLGERG